MITFFKKIRKKLISENRTTKYLLYAIGEILLVVIGILIALQVNNWNETKKDRNKEQVYLGKLANNLRDDINLLQEILHEDSLMIEALRRISNELLTAEKIEDADIRDNALFKALQFYPNRTTIDNIVSSGQIDILQNEELIEKLLLYYRSVTIYNEGIDYSLKNYSRDIEHFLTGFDHRHEHPSLPKKSIKAYRDDPFFLNSMYFKTGLLMYQMRNYRILLKEAVEILGMVEVEWGRSDR